MEVLLKDKTGIATTNLIVVLFMCLAGVIVVGVLLFTYNQMSTALDLDVVVTTNGSTLRELNAVSFGVFNNALLNNADYIGLGLIFGMIIFLIFSAYVFRGTYPRLFIVVDIFILIASYIIAVYIAYTYQMLITSTAELSFFIDYMPRSSQFILYLNRWVALIGVMVMVITYSMFPSDRDNPRLEAQQYEGAY